MARVFRRTLSTHSPMERMGMESLQCSLLVQLRRPLRHLLARPHLRNGCSMELRLPLGERQHDLDWRLFSLHYWLRLHNRVGRIRNLRLPSRSCSNSRKPFPRYFSLISLNKLWISFNRLEFTTTAICRFHFKECYPINLR